MGDKQSELEKALAGLTPKQRELFLQKLKQRREAAPATTSSTIPRRKERDDTPLSAEQRRLWFLQRLSPDSAALNFPIAARLQGEVGDWRILSRGLADLIRRHEVLRTLYEDEDGEPAQRVLPPPDASSLDFRFEDVSTAPMPLERARQMVIAAVARPFTLDRELPVRGLLIRTSATEHVLLLLFHHIATDEWTARVIIEELSELCAARREGRESSLDPLPIQYGDYAAWQRQRLTGQVHSDGIEFWKEHLRDAPAAVEWPPLVKSEVEAGAQHIEIDLDSEAATRLRALAQQNGTSLFVGLQALFAAALARWTGQTDVTLGIPVAQRTHGELHRMIGFFLNTVPIRWQVPLTRSFASWLQACGPRWRDAATHQFVPLDEIARATGAQGRAGFPLFNVIFTYFAVPDQVTSFAGLRIDPFDFGGLADAQTDLTVTFTDGDGLRAKFEYDPSCLSRADVGAFGRFVNRFLRACAISPQAPMVVHALASEQVRKTLLAQGSSPAIDVDRTLLHRQFERRVREEPHAVALRFEGGSWTYTELNERSNRVAHMLSERGVGANQRVGISALRSPELVAAMVGVLKSGGAYVALEPGLPPERLKYMISDAGARLIVCDEAGERSLAGTDVERIDLASVSVDPSIPCSNLSQSSEPGDLAYILYTSGSTGTPKGVMIPHQAMLGHVAAMNHRFAVDGHVVLQKTPFGFDVSVPEIFQVLTTGSSLYVSSLATDGDPRALAEELHHAEITDLRIVPALLSELVATSRFANLPALKRVISAGEALPPSVRARFYERSSATLINQWGPTETTVYGTYWECERGAADAAVPIGYPLEGKQLYVLDDWQMLAPLGHVGELYVGGDELANGYCNKPRQTAVSFVPSPFGTPGARLYRSGDLTRWSAHGALMYHGRRDRQVQLHGVRIELAEIEARLEGVDGVLQAAVQPVGLRNGSAESTAAYIVMQAGQTLEPSAARLQLSRYLPQAVIPTQFIFLEEMPTTASGKIDRRALPAPGAEMHRGEFTAPTTPTEVALAQLWCEHLGLDRVGIHDNFFEIGGHSLLAVRLQASIVKEFGVELPLQQLLEAPTITELAACVESGDDRDDGPIGRHDYGGRAPLSADQRRMWFLQKLSPQSTAYQFPIAVELEGEVDPDALRRAVQALVNRHEVLRTLYPEEAQGPVQRILPSGTAVRWESMRARGDELARAVEVRIARSFNLGEETALRVTWIDATDGPSVLLLLFHHIAIDEWTTHVVLQEIRAFYESFLSGREALLPELLVQYADYAIWQNERLESAELTAGLEYWSSSLEGASDRIEWPWVRMTDGASAAATVIRRLGADLSPRLRQLARTSKTSLFTLTHALFAAFLARLTNVDDLTIGLPVTTRDRPEIQGLVGFFLNTIPMRSRIAPTATFSGWLDRAIAEWNAANRQRWVPLEEIVRASGAKSSSGLPLFDVMFTYVPGAMTEGTFGPATIRAFDYGGVPQPKTSLFLFVTDEGDDLGAYFEYDTAQFAESAVTQLAEQFVRFVGQCIERPDAPMAQIELVGRPQSDRVTNAWARGDTLTPDSRLVHERFEACASNDPGRIALVCADDDAWTYGELNAHANQLGRWLRDHGAGPGVPVGVSVARSPQLIAALFAVLKSGSHYVALQPSLPAERLAYMLADSGAQLIVTDDVGRTFGTDKVLDVNAVLDREETNLDIDVSDADLAYVLYTSGSTGRPKGVMLPHAAVRNLLQSVGHHYGERPEDVVLQKTPYSFDISVSEIFSTLTRGARLVVTYADAERSPATLVDLIRQHEVSVLRMTPTELSNLLRVDGAGACTSVRRVLSCGEALTPLVRDTCLQTWPQAELVNLWGPTEACVYASWFPCTSEDPHTVPIGKPLADYTLLVLDDLQRPVAEGVLAELCVGGDSLARGYHGLPAKTAQAYLPNPFDAAPGARMYRSGDRVAWRPDGVLVFQGRTDDQIQLRGLRVELGEIEFHLERAPGVASAAVTVVYSEDGRAEALQAYVVPIAEAELQPSALREHLAQHIDTAKIPGRFIRLQEMPRTPSGKVDRKNLPTSDDMLRRKDRVAPSTPTEQRIAAIWCELLELSGVGVHENFFELGGHSLLAVRAQGALTQALDVDVPLQLLLDAPTIHRLAAHLDHANLAQRDAITRHDYGDVAPLSADQQRMWFLQRINPSSAAYHVPLRVKIDGALQAEALRQALQGLVARHEVLRSTFPEGQDGEPFQKIAPTTAAVHWTERDFEVEAEPLKTAASWADAFVAAPFDLTSEPPLRVGFGRLSADSTVLVLLFHHIAIDEWSAGIALTELEHLYSAAVHADRAAIPAVELQYADYAIWQAERLESDALVDSLSFWESYLEDAPATVDWPMGRPSISDSPAPEAEVTFHWSPDLTAAFRDAARSAGTTEFVAMCAALSAFLSRYTGQRDITMGLPVTMRDRPELQPLIGFLLNTVPLRTRLDFTHGFGAWIAQVQSTWRDVSAHQWVPMDHIVRAVGGNRSAGSLPMFDVMFSHVQALRPPPSFADLSVEPFASETLPHAKCALSVTSAVENGRMAGAFAYDARQFDAREIRQMVEAFEQFVAAGLRDPERAVLALSLFDGNDQLRAAEQTLAAKDVVAQFEQLAAEHPDNIALVGTVEQMTYGELDAYANGVASSLTKRGVGPGDLVSVKMRRSPELLIAALGVLKSGAALLPLDPDYPKERLDYMVADARPRVELDATAVVRAPVDAFASCDRHPDDIAYVLYTSGSTGKPKGVEISHGALASRSSWFCAEVDLGPGARVLHKTPLGFDVAMSELLTTLSSGATVVLAEDGAHRDPAALVRAIRTYDVTVVDLVPVQLELMLAEPDFGEITSLRVVLSGGDKLSPNVANAFRSATDIRLINAYGPTETTIDCTTWEMPAREVSSVPIGAPSGQMNAAVLDSALEVLPPGLRGELSLGGPQLARGYLRRAGLTADRFVPAVGGCAGARMYRTGDLVRADRDGVLSFVGRADSQQKIRGVRIELNEVSAAVSTFSGVVQTFVDVEPERTQLVAFVVVDDDSIDAAAIHSHAAELLPVAVVPSVEVVDHLPLMPSGKVDRAALWQQRSSGDRKTVEPQTETERVIASIWREQLELEAVGVHDSFFQLGGHSLLAVRAQHQLGEVTGRHVPIQALFDHPTIARLAAYLDSAELSADGVIGHADYGDDAPVSAEQSRMWFLQTMDPQSVAYHVPTTIRFEGLNPDALHLAVQQLVDRHEILRTVFPNIDGAPRQRILPAGTPIAWEYVDRPEADQHSLARALTERLAHPFRLHEEPAVRATLWRESSDSHVLLLLFHHIAIDEWSDGVVLAELAELYRAIIRDTEPALPPVTVQYADYAIWQQARLAGDAADASRAFWRDHLQGGEDRIAFPIGRESDAARPPAATVELALKDALISDLRRFAQDRDTTLFTVLYAAVAGYLSTWTGQHDLTIGLPMTMRDRPELQNLVGFALNTVPLRSRVDPAMSFGDWLRKTDDAWRQTSAHRWLPFEEIVRGVAGGRDHTGSPLFDTIFTYVPAQDGASQTELLRAEGIDLGGAPEAKTTLAITAFDYGESLTLTFEFDASRFERADLQSVASQFARFLRDTISKPDVAMVAHELIAADDMSAIDSWARGLAVEQPDESVPALFARAAAEHPDRVAVIGADSRWTYAELESRSNRLAHQLIQAGVRSETPVGVHVERSPQAVMTLLGIMKAGCAYVPLEPHQPVNRLRYTAENADVRVIVSDGSGEEFWTDEVVISLDDIDERIPDTPPDLEIHGDQLCYVLYTSGSTGRPKGVMLPHRAVINLYRWCCEELGMDRNQVSVFKSPLSFDVSVVQIFPALLSGASVVCTRPQSELDPPHVAAAVRKHNVSWICTVPLQLGELLQLPDFLAADSLRFVVVGGESWSVDIRQQFLAAHGPGILRNGYGPTETCVLSNTWVCRDAPTLHNPIGGPASNFSTHIIDTWLRRVAPATNGELVIGGPGLARGYRAMPRRTALTFVPNVFDDRPGARIYRTGDVVRWNSDGEVEYLSRLDSQVQLQGLRTELPEVEAAIERAPGIRTAAVRVVESGERRIKVLAGYVVAEAGARVDLDVVQAFLEADLPGPMIPKFWMVLERMPLTTSGKIDRRALPQPDTGDTGDTGGQVAPRTATETVVSEVWRRHLQVAEMGVHDSFFALGGHSLMAVRIQHELGTAFGIELTIQDIFRHPTVAALAEFVDSTDVAAHPRIPRTDYGNDAPLSWEQRRMWFLQQLDPQGLAYQVPVAARIRGPLDAAALRCAVFELVERHEVLRTLFVETEAGPRQKILTADTFSFEEATAQPDRAAELMSEQISQPFDLQKEPPLRARLVGIAPDEHLLLLLFHHIAIDEWSIGLVLHELGALYAAAREGTIEESGLEPAGLQYADYASWQQQQLASPSFAAGRDFWAAALEGSVDHIDWPIGSEAADRLGTAGRAEVEFRDKVLDQLRQVARDHGTTRFAVLHGLVASYLTRWTGQCDITLGVPVTLRNSPQLRSMVGFALNTIPYRSRIEPQESFSAWIGRAADNWRRTQPHQWMPLEEIVRSAGSKRSSEAMPLFDTMFTYVNEPEGTPAFGDLDVAMLDPGDPPQAKAAFTITATETEEALVFNFEFDQSRFDAVDVERMTRQFDRFLRGCLSFPQQPMATHQLLDDRAIERTLAVRATGAEFEIPTASYPALFEETARRHADQTAVVFDGGRWSYRELEARTRAVAAALVAVGIGSDTPVGVSLHRSPHLVAALLGVMRAGGAFVPLEPSLPSDRLRYMAEDAGVRVAVCDSFGAEKLPPGVTAIEVGDTDLAQDICLPPEAAEPEHLAYILYTSGSTGRPKGVMIPHRALAALATSYAQTVYDVGEADAAGHRVFMVKASYTFDMFVAEVFPALASGATLAIGPVDIERNPAVLARFLDEHGVTDLWSTPTGLRMLLEAEVGSGTSLKSVYSGGEALTSELARDVAQRWGVVLWNLYGPTEMCVGQTATVLDTRRDVTTIGRPTAGHRVWLVDPWSSLRDTEQSGEIVIAGFGEARGYANMPRRTATTFVPCPFDAPGGRMYATGDLARWDGHGQIHYRGRSDDQLQIRGVRIELAGIEAHLENAPGVALAAVRAVGVRDGRADALVGYIVPSGDGTVQIDAVRAHLMEALPDAAIPGRLVTVSHLPTNAAGKIDREALPEAGVRPTSGISPRTATEVAIAAIWTELLGLDSIAVHDHFFDIGGHSLLAVQAQRRISKEVGLINLETFFQDDTIAGIAATIDLAVDVDDPTKALVTLREGDRDRPPCVLIHPIGGNLLGYRELLRNFDTPRPVVGLRSVGSAEATVEAMAQRYVDELESAHGPLDGCELVGWSFGGVIAHEMARVLHDRGVDVAHLYLIDAWTPAAQPPPVWTAFEQFAIDIAAQFGVSVDSLQAARYREGGEFERLASVLPSAASASPPELRDRFATFSRNLAAFDRHKPSAIAVPTTLFCATHDDVGSQDRGWGAVSEAALKIIAVDADHYGIMRGSFARMIATQIVTESNDES